MKPRNHDTLSNRTRRWIALTLLSSWAAAALWWWLLEPRWLGLAASLSSTLLLRWRWPAAFEPPRPEERVAVTDEGVFRDAPGGIQESVRWADLCRVTAITTDEGPYLEDFFFALHDRGGGGCLVSQAKAVEIDLVTHLQRLPGFHDDELIRACGSTVCAEYVLWERPRESRERT